MIVPAQKSEIPEILSLTKACAQEMIARNIYQWNEHYPTQQAFENDITRNELYVLKIQESIIGTLVISTHKDAEYDDINWLTPDGNNLYIHRLAVHPKHQGKGNAHKLMEYVYAFAKAKKATSLRLDTFSQNKRNQKFYEGLGFQKLGNIFFPKQSEHPFYCYEHVLA